MKKIFDFQEILYEAGARNFLFIDVPPMDRSPAGNCTIRAPKVLSTRVNFSLFSQTVPASLPLPRYDRWNITLQSSAEAFSSARAAATVLIFSSHATFSRVLDDPVGHNFGAMEVRRTKGEIWMDRLHPTSKTHNQFLGHREFTNTTTPEKPLKILI
jgi:hypothetical protein